MRLIGAVMMRRKTALSPRATQVVVISPHHLPAILSIMIDRSLKYAVSSLTIDCIMASGGTRNPRGLRHLIRSSATA